MKILTFILVCVIGTQAQGSLFFGAGTPSNVKHPKLWTVNTDYGPFFIEAIWKPKTPQHLGYGISDGPGGQHTILLGYASNDTHWGVTGNFFTGTGFYSFSTAPVGRLDEWAHVALGYDGATVRIWVNGLIVWEGPYSGSRKYLAGGSDGNLYIGGSFHNNFGGNIARVRLKEGSCPFSTDFGPQLFFTRRIITNHVEDYVLADFVADYSGASEIFPDLGQGLGGEKRDGVFSRLTADTSWPVFQNDRVNGAAPGTFTPPSIPDGALVFDSFTRPNSTQLFSDVFTLGQTEGGSLGPMNWSQGFGILAEAAFARWNAVYQNVLPIDRLNVDVRVDRVWQTNTALALRYVDQWNFLYISGTNTTVQVIPVINGVWAGQAIPVPQGYTTLRAVVAGNEVTVFTDGANLGTFTVPSSLNGTRHGLAYAGSRSFYDNFTVYPVP